MNGKYELDMCNEDGIMSQGSMTCLMDECDISYLMSET